MLRERTRLRAIAERLAQQREGLPDAIGSRALDTLAERVVKPALRRCAACKKQGFRHGEVDHEFQLDQTLPKWRGWYALRRGVATAVADLSGSLAAKGLLRHSNVSTTERHFIKDMSESTLQAMELLEELCNECANQAQAKPN